METTPPEPVLVGTVANNTPYIVTSIVGATIAILGAVLVAVLRPGEDNLTIIVAIFGFMTTTTTSILAFQKAQETHLSVNSRLDGFIKNASAAAEAKGVSQGMEQANARTDEINSSKK